MSSDAYYQELRELAEKLRTLQWEKMVWKKGPALRKKDGGSLQNYYGQSYDPKEFDLIEDGWEHDHCEFCWITISDCDHEKCSHQAYTCEDVLICPDCYQHIIRGGEDPEQYLKSKHRS